MAVIDKYGPAKLSDFMFYTSLVNWLGVNATNQAFIESVSPVDMIDANTPPTYIIHGDADPTVPYSQSVILQEALQQAGVKNKFTTVPGGGHGGFPAAYNTQFETEVIQFLNEVITDYETKTGIEPSFDANVKIGVDKKSINIFSDEITKATLYDALGKQVLETNQQLIQVRENGFYFIKIQLDNIDFVQKVWIR
jgi:hypothetical protein